MPRFLLLTIILTVLLCLSITAVILFVPPSPWLAALLLAMVATAIFFVISLSRYLVISFLARRPREPRGVYRGGFRFSLLISAAVTVFLLLRVWRAATLLNTVLVLAIAILAGVYFRGLKKRSQPTS